MSEEEESETPSLADLLLDKNLLSIAQIELAIADQEINDLPLEEILIVRGWMTREKIYEIAPWLKPGAAKPAAKKSEPPAPKETAKPVAGTSATAKPETKPATTDSATPSKPAAKPPDIPKEPPVRPTGEPPVIQSPLQPNPDALKAYKELLRKILASDK